MDSSDGMIGNQPDRQGSNYVSSSLSSPWRFANVRSLMLRMIFVINKMLRVAKKYT
jgi:hypothetical protein